MISANRSPKVSVCIPTYNYGRFVADAIESVLGQTFSDFELLVVDNCSTDNTRELVENYTRRDARVAYFCNEANLGMVGNWNRCLEHASGEYVKILCADDLLVPTCLGRQVIELEKNPEVVLVTCARQVTTADLIPIKELRYAESYTVVSGADAIRMCFTEGNLIGEPTAVLFRRKAAGRGFDMRYRQLVDQEMWFHLLEQGSFAFLPEALCMFRQHDEQATNSNITSLALVDDEFLIYNQYGNKEYLQLPFLRKQKLKFLKALFCWNYQQNGVDRRILKQKIAGFYSLPLFYLLLVIKRILDASKRLIFFTTGLST
jgi:glycosyltransferase involved in cell wall biosynthesis